MCLVRNQVCSVSLSLVLWAWIHDGHRLFCNFICIVCLSTWYSSLLCFLWIWILQQIAVSLWLLLEDYSTYLFLTSFVLLSVLCLYLSTFFLAAIEPLNVNIWSTKLFRIKVVLHLYCYPNWKAKSVAGTYVFYNVICFFCSAYDVG